MATLFQPESDAPAIQLTRVSQIFGNFVALRDVSLRLPQGSSVVLLGENGAGKSTLLRLLAGLSFPSRGEVLVLGTAPRDMRGRIAYMSHTTMLYDELSGPENLRYFASLGAAQPMTPQEQGRRAVAALEAVGLDPSSPRRVGEYSQGMRQRASLARVLLSEPDLLLLDEPFSNLDAASSHAMIDRLQTFLKQPGTDGRPRTLVLTTHQAELAKPLAETTLVLAAGRVAQIVERRLVKGAATPGEVLR